MLPRTIKSTVNIKSGLALARPVRGGKHDGKLIIKNFKPKTTGGKHEVLDETYRDSASFKETDEGSLTE